MLDVSTESRGKRNATSMVYRTQYWQGALEGELRPERDTRCWNLDYFFRSSRCGLRPSSPLRFTRISNEVMPQCLSVRKAWW